MQNQTLPILLKNQKILLIGGGNVALQKAQVLSHNEIDFTILSKELNDEILFTTSKIIRKAFKLKDIGSFAIIIDATGDPKVAKKLVKYKKKHPILLNVVDVPKLCDFYFMALTPNRPLQIAVSSNGASPTAAKYFRNQCEKLIPDDISTYLSNKQKERNCGIIDIDQTQKELDSLLETKASLPKAKVFLVGCGLGDVELLTIKAYRVIQEVDVVLYDHLISDEIMEIVPQDTLKVSVGKQKGFHSKSQEEINALIIHYAAQGKSVARLKSGDPFVFGRGAEELLDLINANIPTQVIAGISSSISGCSTAGIPITARGYAAGFTVVSAHLKNNSVNLDWVELLDKPNHTVVVLMGLSRAKEIVRESLRLGIAQDRLCAIISNASRPNQKVATCSLSNLEHCAKSMERPAILVFGDVVKFHKIFNG
ncbi:MAG: uroporphyrinogen-III C-methyltransferase [Campylobacterota bacterium]|nr:uroporphyrinogen-III C-methyltransferase [Campylobacterota bacterium]